MRNLHSHWHFLFSFFKKLMTKVKDGDPDTQWQAAGNTSDDDLTSYFLVSTEVEHPATNEERSEVMRNNEYASVQDALNLLRGARLDDASSTNTLNNSVKSLRSESIPSLASTSSKLITDDCDAAVSDLAPNYSRFRNDLSISQPNLLRNGVAEQTSPYKLKGCKVDDVYAVDGDVKYKQSQTVSEVQRSEENSFDMSSSESDRLSDITHEDMYLINIVERNKMKATGAVPKIRLTEHSKIHSTAYVSKSCKGSLSPRSCYPSNLSDTETNRGTDSGSFVNEGWSFDINEFASLASSREEMGVRKEASAEILVDTQIDTEPAKENETNIMTVQNRTYDQLKGEDIIRKGQSEGDWENELMDLRNRGTRQCISLLQIDKAGCRAGTGSMTIQRDTCTPSVSAETAGRVVEATVKADSVDIKKLFTSAQLHMQNLQCLRQTSGEHGKNFDDSTSVKPSRNTETKQKARNSKRPSRKTSVEYSSRDRNQVNGHPPVADSNESASSKAQNVSLKKSRQQRSSSSHSVGRFRKEHRREDGKFCKENILTNKHHLSGRKGTCVNVPISRIPALQENSTVRGNREKSSTDKEQAVSEKEAKQKATGTSCKLANSRKSAPSKAQNVSLKKSRQQRSSSSHSFERFGKEHNGGDSKFCKENISTNKHQLSDGKGTLLSKYVNIPILSNMPLQASSTVSGNGGMKTSTDKEQAASEKAAKQNATVTSCKLPDKSKSNKCTTKDSVPKSGRAKCKNNNKKKTELAVKEMQIIPKSVNVDFCNESVKEEAVIEDYLRNLLPAKTSFKVTNISSTDEIKLPTKFTVTVEFPSTNQAKRAVTMLTKTSSQTNVRAHFVKKDGALERGEKAKFLHQQRDEIMQKGHALLEKHQSKIDELNRELDKFKVKKHIPLNMYEKIKIEKEAIQSKLEELVHQKKEFIIHYKQLLDRILSLEQHNRPRDEVNKLRMEFGRECLKLTTALPIYARRREIIDLVRENPVSIILGETGSGKSTQLVQYIDQAQSLGLGELGSKMIVCTEPRKVAAQSLARHVADEMATSCGGIVGYKTGFQSNVSPSTKVVFTTDHTLLNECLKDPTLERYSCIIIDEAHERSICTDLLLGMIKKCLVYRKDLRVIVTSATIDPEVFVKYFGGAPVLRVSGRMFPVDVVYKQPSDPQREDYLAEAVETVQYIHQQEAEGDVLVFLTSPIETQKACEKLSSVNGLICLPLHGQLQAREQQLVFEPVSVGKRKVVFATNSAETSITIPGIKYVVDTGRVKEKIFDAKKNMSALVVKAISKSSAEQRKGRAGRMSSGKCYRLYTEEDFSAMEPIALPEILRVHLGQALLKLMEIGIADPLSFEFVQSPSPDALQNAMKILTDLQAINELGITELGKRMALLPVEPRMAKVIFDAIAQGCALEGIAVAALSSITGGVFYRMGTEEDKKQADYFKTRFCQAEGDIQTYLHVYKEWNSIPEKQKSEWCFKNYINGKSIRACRETVHEIRRILHKDLGIDIQYNFTHDFKCSSLSCILLDCFKSNIGYFTGHDRSGYFVVNDKEKRFLQMHPSSSLSYLASSPKWVVYLDVLKTSKDYMLNVVTIDDCDVQKKVEAGDLSIDQSRLEEVTLSECVAAEVGASLMSALIGPKFQNLKSMEKELSEKHNRPVVLDIDRDRCQMKTFTSPVLFDDIRQYLHQRIAPERCRLKKEFSQIPITHNSNTRAVIEAGGQCSVVLMPDETRTVLLRNVPDNWTEADVELELGKYGEVCDILSYKGSGNWGRNNKTWGKVTFSESSLAKMAMDSYTGDILLVPEGISKATQSKNEFKVRIQWRRRPTRGFAIVKPRDPEDAMLLAGQIKIIGESIAMIRYAKDDPTKLFVSRLSNEITDVDVRNSLSQDISIESVFMPRMNVGETQPEKASGPEGTNEYEDNAICKER